MVLVRHASRYVLDSELVPLQGVLGAAVDVAWSPGHIPVDVWGGGGSEYARRAPGESTEMESAEESVRWTSSTPGTDHSLVCLTRGRGTTGLLTPHLNRRFMQTAAASGYELGGLAVTSETCTSTGEAIDVPTRLLSQPPIASAPQAQSADKSLVCACGRSFFTTGALAFHQRSCTQAHPKPLNDDNAVCSDDHEAGPAEVYACACGRDFNTNRGRSVHQRKCPVAKTGMSSADGRACSDDGVDGAGEGMQEQRATLFRNLTVVLEQTECDIEAIAAYFTKWWGRQPSPCGDPPTPKQVKSRLTGHRPLGKVPIYAKKTLS